MGLPAQPGLRGVSQKKGSVEGQFPQTYYTSFSDFSTGITQVTFTGSQFAESTETAVLKVEEKVNGSKFVPTKIPLSGKPVFGARLLFPAFLKHAQSCVCSFLSSWPGQVPLDP